MLTPSECLSVASVIQQAMRMRPIVICGLPDSTVIFTLSRKRYDFLKKIVENKICVLICSDPSV